MIIATASCQLSWVNRSLPPVKTFCILISSLRSIRCSVCSCLSFQGSLVVRSACLQSLITAPGSLTDVHMPVGRTVSQDYALISSRPHILPRSQRGGSHDSDVLSSFFSHENSSAPWTSQGLYSIFAMSIMTQTHILFTIELEGAATGFRLLRKTAFRSFM